MRAMGIANVRIGEFAWARIEPRRGELISHGSIGR